MQDFSKWNLFICSDAHAYHTNIVSGVTKWRDENGEIPFNDVRDFQTMELMTSTLIYNINNKVGKNDLLIHGGDWSFGGLENVYNFRKQLICQNIININGNHDQHIGKGKILVIDGKEIKIDSLFMQIHNQLEFKYDKDKFIFNHYPFLSWDKKEYINIHGHIHRKGDGRFNQSRQGDCGFDGNPNFEPYHITEFLNLIIKQYGNISKNSNRTIY